MAFLNAGYSVSHIKYTFYLSNSMNSVILVLPKDPSLSVSGDLYKTRSENWRRGASTLDLLKARLSKRYKEYDFESLTLIGHSNGGDISAWLSNESKIYIQQLITLDHRGVPLPRNSNIKVLSIRASDFPAHKGVLPAKEELQINASCIVTIPSATHNEMIDFGPAWLKEK